MTEQEQKLFDKLMQHNSAYYGYELSKGEIKTVLQAFTQLDQYREQNQKVIEINQETELDDIELDE